MDNEISNTASANAEGAKGVILLVDDDKFLLDMYSMKFQNAGYDVHACLSAEDSLKELREGLKPDVILLDLIMPEYDGFSFLSALAKENLASGSVVIALTNESDDKAKKRAIESGADSVLEKATMIPTEVLHLVEEEIGKLRTHTP